MNLYSLLEQNAEIFAASPAVIDGITGNTLTYQGLKEQIDAVGFRLKSIGINEGDRVALYLPNSPEFIIAYFAIVKIGAIVVPFNILFKSDEVQYILQNSAAKAIIGSLQELLDNLLPIAGNLEEPISIVGLGKNQVGKVDFWLDDWLNEKKHCATVSVQDDQPAAILYTSGTTGKAKGAILAHGNLAANAKLNGYYLLGLNDHDRTLSTSPYCHIYFVQIGLGPLMVGASLITLPRSSPELALSTIEKFRVTHFSGVPTIFNYMLQRYDGENYDLTSWRVAGSAAASISPELVTQIVDKFGVDFFEAYGSTEAASTIAYTRLRNPKPGSIGMAAPGYKVRLIDDLGQDVTPGDVGELLAKGPGIFIGYWGMPEATKEAFTSDGWYKTGDLARMDVDGNLYIVDRKKHMIISGGYNIYPREVEEVLLTHPDILEAAVVGKEDDNLGEIPIGYIITKKGASLSQDKIIDFCGERLAKYKIPRSLEIVQNFPRTGSGKILKRMLVKSS